MVPCVACELQQLNGNTSRQFSREFPFRWAHDRARLFITSVVPVRVSLDSRGKTRYNRSCRAENSSYYRDVPRTRTRVSRIDSCQQPPIGCRQLVNFNLL